MDKRPASTTALNAFCILLGLFKLWLVSGEEIVARFQPLDDLWQILAASRGYWFGSEYNWMTFVRLPVYPIWVAGVYLTGTPLRIAIELLYLASSFAFVLALVHAKIPKFLAAFIYISIILHPASFSLFNYALAETLYAPILLLTLAAMISMWTNREEGNLTKRSILSGACLAVLWHTRPETVLLQSILFCFSLITIYVLWREKKKLHEIMRIMALITLLPCAIIFTTTLIVKTANWAKTGLFMSTEISSGGYASACKALLSIKPKTSLRFIPVTKEARQAAYAVSPAFKELQPYLEGTNFGTLETQRTLGIEGEIAAGWFYWVLKQSAEFAGHGKSPREMNAYFQQVADEINSAFNNGKLPYRAARLDLVDPDTSNFLPYLSGSLLKLGRVFISTTAPTTERDDANVSIRRAFNVVANRRTEILVDPPTTMSGWIFSRDIPITKLLLRDKNGTALVSSETFSARPDVRAGFAASGMSDVPENSGFSLMATAAPEEIARATLVVETAGKEEATIPMKDIVIGQVEQLNQGVNGTIIFAIDALTQKQKTHTTATSIQGLIWSTYGTMLSLLGYVGILAFFIHLWRYKSIDPSTDNLTILWLLAAAIASRTLLLAIIDASSWPGDQIRYIFPAMQIYACFLILLIYSALNLFRIHHPQNT